jgi:hypothetical protein
VGRPGGPPGRDDGQTGTGTKGGEAIDDITSGDDPAADKPHPGQTTKTAKPDRSQDETETEDETEDETEETSSPLLSSAPDPQQETNGALDVPSVARAPGAQVTKEHVSRQPAAPRSPRACIWETTPEQVWSEVSNAAEPPAPEAREMPVIPVDPPAPVALPDTSATSPTVP